MSLVCYPVFFLFYNMENCLEKILLFHYGYIIKSRHVCTYKKAVAIAFFEAMATARNCMMKN